MTFAGRYLKDHLSVILMECLFVFIFAVVFSLYHLPLAAVFYPSLLCFLAGAAFLGQGLYRAYERHKRLVHFQSLGGGRGAGGFGKGFSGERNCFRERLPEHH